MATKLPGYSEREKAVLTDCRRKSVFGGLTWGVSSLLPLWVAFRAGLLPRFVAAPCYTASFVLFSFLGAMSNNDSCIENILDLEDSELAVKLRKSLPRQARRYDQKRRAREGTSVRGAEDTSRSSAERDHVASRSATTGGEGVMTQWVDKGREEGERGGGEGKGGEWMERQDNRGGVRRNKYGDIIFDDDVK